MQITVETRGLDTVLRSLGVDLPKQVKYATMLALSRTASKLRDRQYSEMHHVFDRPTPYTLRGLRVKPATKTDLTAWVGFKEAWALRAAKYIPTQVEGGTRKHKGFELAMIRAGAIKPSEYIVPTRNCPLDQHGNVTMGVINKVMSGLQIQGDKYANTTSRSRTRKRSNEWYFITPKGIWQRKGGVTVMLFFRVGRAPSYKKRYPFYELSKGFIKDIWDGEFDKAFKEAMATAK